jgi:AcrR family transcriptional regulator
MNSKTPMRERILDASWDIVTRQGFAFATTKNIAVRAGIAEGTIYNHFTDKTEIIMALALERAGDVRSIFRELNGKIGTGQVSDNLVSALAALLPFYENLQLVISGLFLDLALLEKLRTIRAETDRGPHRSHRHLGEYLEAEQAQRRLPGNRDTAQLADILIGAIHERAFLNVLAGRKFSPEEAIAFSLATVAAIFPEV